MGECGEFEPVSGRVMVPASALSEALQIVDRLERQLDDLDQRLRDAELALQTERNRRRPWWVWWRRSV